MTQTLISDQSISDTKAASTREQGEKENIENISRTLQDFNLDTLPNPIAGGPSVEATASKPPRTQTFAAAIHLSQTDEVQEKLSERKGSEQAIERKTAVSMPLQYPVRSFHGHQDGFEEPADYIEDIEIAIRRDYSGQIAENPGLKNVADPAKLTPVLQETYEEMKQDKRSLFRQGIKGIAEQWHNRLDRGVKNDWEKLKEAFLVRFALPEEDPIAKNATMEKLYEGIKQGREEKITSYLGRADDFHAQYGSEKPFFGWKLVTGLRDQQKSQIIAFHMRQSKKFDYSSARQMVMDAYTGADNPFSPTGQEPVTEPENDDHDLLRWIPGMICEMQKFVLDRETEPLRAESRGQGETRE
jgi:hypothetical protein